MAEGRFLRCEQSEGVARITLARPKHNVLNIDMMNELNGLLDTLAGDDDLKCVAIFGEGKSWCAGVEVGDHKPGMVDEMVTVFNGIFERIHRLDVPTVAAVHGVCVGGGMELAIACDIVVASERAKFGQPEIKLGFFPPYAVVRLPELIGPAKTVEVCTAGKIYSAEEARGLGFVGHVVPEERFSEAVEKMIGEIRYNSPLIIRLNKRAVKKCHRMPFSDAVAAASDAFLNTLMKTEDTLEGIASFEEKRKPEWKNR